MQNIETIIFELLRAVETKQPLHPVFDNVFVHISKPSRISRNPAYAPNTLDRNDILSTISGISLDAVKEESNRIQALSPKIRIDTTFYLLQKYGWRIGAPDKEELQDVAFCDSKRIEYALSGSDTDKYILVKGDLSGIQGYIYGNLKPKVSGATGDLAKRLRGRSTIVSLLTDFLAKLILQELDLSIWHLLFAGGGHFNLLLPKSKEGELNVLSEKLDKEMQRWFGDRLTLILAWVEADRTIENEANVYFQQVNEAIKNKKYRQHHTCLEGHFFLPAKSDNDDLDKLEIEIGTQFPKQCMVALVASKEGIPVKNYALPVLDFEMHKYHYQLLLVNGKEKQKALNNADGLLANRTQFDFAQLLFINYTDFMPSKDDWDYKANPNVGFGFLLMGRHIPVNKASNIPKDFEELCFHQNKDGTLTPEQMKRGFMRLGALRLDVDDLGFVFSNGLGKDATLGQIACLSRELHTFFTVHFDRRAEEHEIYLIYSGGDDAFVVGRWDKIIAFANQIQQDFKDFTMNPQNLHFSAGIFMGDPKYPVGRFYRDAGQLQDEAKSGSKNKVDVFDQVMGWKDFDSKINLGKSFAEILTKGETPSKHKLTLSFANRVLQLVKSSFHERSGYDDNGQPIRRGFMDVQRFSRNIASMRYLFARHGYTNEEIAKVKEEMEKQLTTDFINSFDYDAIGKPDKQKRIRNYLVAFNYALYTIRSQEKSSKS